MIASLGDLATTAKTADEILTAFVGYTESRGLTLYPAQEEALLELVAGKHVILNTPTGSGKSLVASALLFKALCEGKNAYYTCPVKALANEKFFAFCAEFGAAEVGMQTGDATINPDARLVACTAEVLSNIALRKSRPRIDYVVMDEFHYYGDRERGVAWQVPLLALDEATFLLMSATLGDMTTIERSLTACTEREVVTVRTMQRPVPLEYEYRETPLHETLEELVTRGRAPVYLVNFSQRAAAEEAQNLTSVNLCTKEEKLAIAEAIADFHFDTPYAKEFQRFVRAGIGVHHAGLLPKYRLLVEKLAQRGLLKVVSGTDTLGVGVNIPIRTVLFTQLCKFDGEKSAQLSARDFHQIAGRAGRKGFDDQGWVAAQAPAHAIENARLSEKKAAGKKVVLQKPPQKGYVHWDRAAFDRLVGRAPEPLESRFAVSHGMLLEILQGDPFGYRRLVSLVTRSHSSEHQKRQLRRQAKMLFRTLLGAGLVEIVRDDRARHPVVEVNTDLQHDFSLHHTLSLYLVETLRQLDAAQPTYAFDVLSLCESILENPHIVLLKQLDALKTKKLDELKAAGVEYAERMEELDKLEWPKPLRDFIYETFNAFAGHHPWVGEQNIRPKSVARDMVERFCNFNDYVRDYGLERSEGVLLRYLSQAYKTLLQTVPERLRTDEIDDILEQLRLVIRTVDSSLLDEWQRQKNDPIETAPVAAPAAAEQDPKAFERRVRAEMHRFLVALGRRQYEAAATLLRGATAAQLESEMQKFFAEHAQVDTTPRARRPSETQIRPGAEPKTWLVSQRLHALGEEEDAESLFAIEARVDGREEENALLLEFDAIR